MSRFRQTKSIVHVSDAYFPEVGGVERVIQALAGEQVQAGHRVTVLAKALATTLEQEQVDGVEVLRYAHRARPTIVNYISSVVGAGSMIKYRFGRHHPTLIHSHLTLASQGPMAYAKRNAIPLIASFYGPWDREFEVEAQGLWERSGRFYRNYQTLQMAAQRWMQRRLLQRADRVIVLSDYSAMQAGRLVPEVGAKIVKVPGGIDEARFRPIENLHFLRRTFNLPSDSFLIFTLRRLTHRMGVDLLIDAMADERMGKGNAFLVIGGTGPLESDLKQRAGQVGVTDRVAFVGHIPESDLPAAYRDADLVVLPTRAQENFGLPILEAAACETPVVGTPVGSIPEVLGRIDPRMVAGEATSASLAERISWVCENREQVRRTFEQVGEKIRTHFAWKKVADRIEQVYDEVIA